MMGSDISHMDKEAKERQKMVRAFGPRLPGDALLQHGNKGQGRKRYLEYLKAHPDHEVAKWWARP